MSRDFSHLRTTFELPSNWVRTGSLRTAFEHPFELGSNSLRTGVFAHSPHTPLACAKHAHSGSNPSAYFAPPSNSSFWRLCLQGESSGRARRGASIYLINLRYTYLSGLHLTGHQPGMCELRERADDL
jgi:hypothetical protein